MKLECNFKKFAVYFFFSFACTCENEKMNNIKEWSEFCCLQSERKNNTKMQCNKIIWNFESNEAKIHTKQRIGMFYTILMNKIYFVYLFKFAFFAPFCRAYRSNHSIHIIIHFVRFFKWFSLFFSFAFPSINCGNWKKNATKLSTVLAVWLFFSFC